MSSSSAASQDQLNSNQPQDGNSQKPQGESGHLENVVYIVLKEDSKPGERFLLGKTWWDWMQFALQILTAFAVPVALFVGAQQFSNQQTTASQVAALDQQREAVLQSYLNHMSDLLLGNNTGKDSALLASADEWDEISQVAWSQTLTVLRNLDGKRKGIVLQFLFDARLIGWTQVDGGVCQRHCP